MGCLGVGKTTSWTGHISTVQHYSGTIFLSHTNFQFPAVRDLFLWAASMNKGKALEQDSHGTCTIFHITEIKKKYPSSISETPVSLLNFPRLKTELLPTSSFPAGYKVMPERNALSNPNLNILYSTVQSTYWKSIISRALLSGTHGTENCPRETFLH